MFIAYYGLYAILAMYSLWVFYLAVMNLKRARDIGTLKKITFILAQPVLILGTLIDVLVNITVCTLMFLELPKESLVTTRLKRHINNEGWRSNIASWICMNLLNQFDPSGNHCK